MAGQTFGCITVLRRGPNDRSGSAQWWVINSLNVEPDTEYLMPRRTLWRKCTGRRPRYGCGFQIKYPALYRSVVNHFKWINNPVGRYSGYFKMPAYPLWNPKEGSSAIVKAVTDILKEIGDKPGKGYNLHIKDRRIGFWPGNLMWVPANRHKRLELLNLVIEENAQLKKRLSKYESISNQEAI
jgi:hypothetical protein